MYDMELYAAVRLAVVEEGLSHHEAGRRFGIDRRTMKKMLSYSSPLGYRRTKPVRRPKLDGFTGIIDGILEADAEVPRKQRHTASNLRCPARTPESWLGRGDSNLRMPVPKTGALTTWPRPNSRKIRPFEWLDKFPTRRKGIA